MGCPPAYHLRHRYARVRGALQPASPQGVRPARLSGLSLVSALALSPRAGAYCEGLAAVPLIPRSVSILGLGSLIASRLWQVLQSCGTILLGSSAAWRVP